MTDKRDEVGAAYGATYRNIPIQGRNRGKRGLHLRSACTGRWSAAVGWGERESERRGIDAIERKDNGAVRIPRDLLHFGVLHVLRGELDRDRLTGDASYR